MKLSKACVVIGLVLGVAACSSGKPLTRLKNPGNGPDEFLITPGKPLQEPTSYSALPTPAPGQANLTDQDPRADGIAALGGNASRSQGVAPADGGLVRHTGRYGTDANIRTTLRTEDDAIRKAYGNRNLLRIGKRDSYTEAYKRQWLNASEERDRLRRSGVVTPTAPPTPN